MGLSMIARIKKIMKITDNHENHSSKHKYKKAQWQAPVFIIWIVCYYSRLF